MLIPSAELSLLVIAGSRHDHVRYKLGIYLLGSHPEIQDKLYEEVEQFCGEIIEGGEGGACWSLYLLGSDPEIQDKLYEEVEQFCGKIAEGGEGGVCWTLYL